MKIVDLSCDVAGRFAAKLFALSGLDVIRPVPQDSIGQAKDEDFLGTYLDAGKTPVSWTNGDMAARGLADADLVFVSFDNGRHQGRAAQLLPLTPKHCVRVTTSTFGAVGAYAKLRGGALAAWSAGGYLAITGEPDREPLAGPEELCGYVAGYTAAIAAEAALARRRRTGEGGDVDISAMESMLCLHQSTFARAAIGEARERTGRYSEVYPLAVFPCSDGYVSIGVSKDDEFDRLCIAAGCVELLSDTRMTSGFSRQSHHEEIDAALEQFLFGHTADEIVEILQANAVPAVKAVEPPEFLTNPQLEFRGYWAGVDGSPGARMPGSPLFVPKVFAKPGTIASSDARVWPLKPRPDTSLPLSGVRVLDFTQWWAGPSATRCLADLGADVIWVERPNSRMDWTQMEPGPYTVMQELYQWKMYRHKRSVVLDMGTDTGCRAAARLAHEADVVIENFRPGVADKLGFGPARLCADNAKLVYVSLSGFGSEGPRSGWRSYGPNIEAASSVAARTGYPGGPPLRLGHALPDAVGGLVGALTALRGLREREERGCGAWYDISQLEAYAAMSGEELLETSLRGTFSPRMGNRSHHGAIQGVFPCEGNDQWIAIRLTAADDLARFVAVTGLTGLVDAAAAVPRDDEAIEAAITAYTASHEKYALSALLQGADLEAVPVFTPPELVADPHIRDRDYFVPVTVDGKPLPMPGSPFRADKAIADSDGRPPRFGEHTSEILAALGLATSAA